MKPVTAADVVEITDPMRMQAADFERVFGAMREGHTGTLVHESGRTFKVRLHSEEPDGDEVVFCFEILAEAAGQA